MDKLFRNFVLVGFICLAFLTGCGDAERSEDTHYKPSEYKHNVAIGNADSTVDQVNKDILQMGAETSADIVYDTYNNSLAKLNEQLTILKDTKKQLTNDSDLTNSELKDWNSRYDSSIEYVETNIKKIEKQKKDFLK